jgi:hypothetical protein
MATIDFVKLRASISGLCDIPILELGKSTADLVGLWTPLSHDKYLLVVLEVGRSTNLTSLEASVTDNLLIHVF